MGCRTSFSAKLLPYIAICILPMLLVACDNPSEHAIQWQLPLTAPDDLHKSQSKETSAPAWAQMRRGQVTFTVLQKSTAKTQEISIIAPLDGSAGAWRIHLLGLAQGLRLKDGAFIDDKSVHNPAAFVEMFFEDRKVYSGWMYQQFPEMFGPDSQDWKLWLKDINILPPQEEQGSLSSAG